MSSTRAMNFECCQLQARAALKNPTENQSDAQKIGGKEAKGLAISMGS